MPIDAWFAVSPWLPLLGWAALYLADYKLTLAGARRYRRGADRHIGFEGSYELTPAFVEAIDSLRPWDRRFLLYWAMGTFLIGMEWVVLVRYCELPLGFALAFGGALGPELAVIVRHLRNLRAFSLLSTDDAAQGRIVYRRWFSLRLSAASATESAVMFTLAAILVRSWLLGGAALGCGLLALRHRRRAAIERRRKSPQNFEKPAALPEGAP